jgi:hypothetical protein
MMIITARTFWLWVIATVMMVGILSGTVAYQNHVIGSQRSTINLLMDLIRR